MRPTVNPHHHGVFGLTIEIHRLEQAVLQHLAIFGLEGAKLRQLPQPGIVIQRVSGLDGVLFHPSQMLTALVVQTHLGRLRQAVKIVEVNRFLVGKHGVMHAATPADALYLTAIEADPIQMALDHTVFTTTEINPALLFI